MDIKNWPYWLKGNIVGLGISLIILLMLFAGNENGDVFGPTPFISFLTFISPLTILFGFIGSIIDYKKNKIRLPLIIFNILFIAIIGWLIIMFLVVSSALVG